MVNRRKRVIYFHGLESAQGGKKVEFLAQKYIVIAPTMDYRNPDMFQEMLELAKDFEPDILVGSSMGGYFAYTIATHTNTPIVLFNPALHSRKFEPENVTQGVYDVTGLVVNGEGDNIINQLETAQMLQNSIDNNQLQYHLGNHGHRTPLAVFKNYL